VVGTRISALATTIVIHKWNFNVDINTIQQWIRNSFLVFGKDCRRKPTVFLLVAKVAARQGRIHTIEHIFIAERALEE